MDEKERKETEASLLKDMEATAARMRDLIVGMPPLELLSYIYAKPLMSATVDQSVDGEGRTESVDPKDLIDQIQFLLEYVHAVLASDAAPDDVKFDETKCAVLFELSRKLREKANGLCHRPHQQERRPAYSVPSRLTSNFTQHLIGSRYAETATKSWKESFTATFWHHMTMSLKRFTA